MSDRIGLSKKLRFEVFKRDGFTCQYCGQKAPDVVLQCDHIDPVAAGGSGDILNLITSCFGCNSGKGSRPLTDHETLNKQRDQLADLQDRRDQLEMMIEWRRGLSSLEDEAHEEVCRFWFEKSEEGFQLSPSGRDHLKKLIKRFGVDLILTAIPEAIVSYARRDENGVLTDPSLDIAFSRIGGVARVIRASKDKPYLRRMFYIRGILRGRLQYVNERAYVPLVERAVELGVNLDSLEKLACTVSSWTAFAEELNLFIRENLEEGER